MLLAWIPSARAEANLIPRPASMGDRDLRDNRRRKWVALATIWTLLILALCWLPMPFFSMGGVGERAEHIPNIDKVIHAGIFAVFGLLWLRAIPGRKRYLIVLLAGLGLASITEIVQSLPLLDRQGDIVDGASDFAGVCVACLIDLALLGESEVDAALPKTVADA